MDLAVERGVAGGIVLVATVEHVLKLVALGVQGEQFYRAQYGHLFEVAVLDAEQGVPPDPVMLAAGLERLGHEPRLSPADIDELASHAPTAGHYVAYAKRLIELARWRARQEALYGMVAALEKRDRKAWDGLLGDLVPEPEPRAKPKAAAKAARTLPAPSDRTGLRLIVSGSTGEVLGSGCEHCQDKDDEIKGLNRDLRGWMIRHENLKRDKEAEARADGMWQTAQRLFEHWKRKTGHTRSPFTATRFYECVPYLRDPKYGPEKVERAIVGLVHDPWVTVRRNGTRNNHDGWDRLFKSSDAFEEWNRCAPLDWKSELNLTVPSAPLESVVEQPAAAG